MPRGGARNRSGPQPDPTSGRSDRRGFKLTALPSEGYTGEVPAFPLAKVPVYDVHFEDKKRVRELDVEATDARWERELELWAWAWRTPQACAWSREPWRWHAVAMWVRTSSLCVSADASGQAWFADQVGLTPAGLRENGWAISADVVGEKRDERPASEPASRPARRLRAVDGGA